MKWSVICMTCKTVLDSMENGSMAEAIGKAHVTECQRTMGIVNGNHEVYVGFKLERRTE